MSVVILLGLSVFSCLKKNRIYAILLLAFLFVLLAFQYGNADYFSYENMYTYFAGRNGTNTFSNIGYKWLCILFFELGLSYDQFLIVEAILGLGIIGYVVFKNCKLPGLVLVLYLIYPYMMDTVQVRNFLAEAVVLLGISLYINLPALRGYIYMAICLLAASLIHVSALVYLVFLLLPLMKTKHVKVLIVFGVLFECVLMAYAKEIVQLLGMNEHVTSYFDKRISVYTAIFLIFYFSIAYIGLNQMKRINPENEKYARWNLIVNRVNILILPFVPLCFITNDFQRIYRNVFLLSYIAVVNLYETAKQHRVAFPKMKLETVLLIGTFGYAAVSNVIFVTSLYWDTVVLPLFENNVLFG